MVAEIEIEGLKEMQRAFKLAPAFTTSILNRAIKASLLILLGRSRQEAPVDRGFLRGAAMQTKFGNLTGLLKNTAPYAFWIHEGTRPHFPPLRAIEPWARRHGIPAFLVARKIARDGTKGVPFFDIAIDKTKTKVDNIFDRALVDITKQLAS